MIEMVWHTFLTNQCRSWPSSFPTPPRLLSKLVLLLALCYCTRTIIMVDSNNRGSAAASCPMILYVLARLIRHLDTAGWSCDNVTRIPRRAEWKMGTASS